MFNTSKGLVIGTTERWSCGGYAPAIITLMVSVELWTKVKETCIMTNKLEALATVYQTPIDG